MAARAALGSVRRRVWGSSSLPLVVACIVVGLVAYGMGRKNPTAVERPLSKAFVPEFETIEVPVPERAVPAGTHLRDIPLRIERFAEHQLPGGAILDISAHSGKVTIAALPGGLPILAENLGTIDEATNPVVGRIPVGMRAMAVKVDATSSVEGWARSGSVVDVLLIEKSHTIVVAEKVKVLSVERSTTPVDDRVESMTPSTVTILVTQEQCLAINTAAPLGRIAFALRGARDSNDWADTTFSSDDLKSHGTAVAPLRVGGRAYFTRDGRIQKFALVDGQWIAEESIESAGRSREAAR